MKTTTLNKIYSFGPCTSGWRKLLRGLGKTAPDDEPLPYSDILRTNGAGDALWSMRCAGRYESVELACRYAESAASIIANPCAAEAVRVARGVIAGTHTPEQARDAATEAEDLGFSTAASAARTAAAVAGGFSHVWVAITCGAAMAESGDDALRERVFLEWASA